MIRSETLIRDLATLVWGLIEPRLRSVIRDELAELAGRRSRPISADAIRGRSVDRQGYLRARAENDRLRARIEELEAKLEGGRDES